METLLSDMMKMEKIYDDYLRVREEGTSVELRESVAGLRDVVGNMLEESIPDFMERYEGYPEIHDEMKSGLKRLMNVYQRFLEVFPKASVPGEEGHRFVLSFLKDVLGIVSRIVKSGTEYEKIRS